jgi:hypothetical protein
MIKKSAQLTVDSIATNTGHLYVAQTPEVFSYDAERNLKND